MTITDLMATLTIPEWIALSAGLVSMAVSAISGVMAARYRRRWQRSRRTLDRYLASLTIMASERDRWKRTARRAEKRVTELLQERHHDAER